MMMSKPTSSEETKEEMPSFAMPPPPTALNVGSVADLERRLAEMGTKKEAAPAPPPQPVVAKPSAPAPATAAAAAAAAAPSVKGGKNALLARIMAAKEKQEKKAAAPPPPPAPVAPPEPSDLLMDFDAQCSQMELPPPSYETNFLKDVPPPAFDVMEQQQHQQQQYQQQQQQQQEQQFPPPPPIESVLPPPPPLNDVLPPPPMPEGDLLNMGFPSAPTASAPMFEDLHTQQEQELHPPPLPPPMEAAAAAPAAPDIDDSILNALDPAEREAFLEEQRKILEQIEKEKSNNEASSAAARAMAFDQRSSSAVANVAASYERGGASRSQPLSSSRSNSNSNSNNRTVDLGGGTEVAVHGSETTQKAIDNGTAVIVKCMSCDNWMQVTEAAELMFCPICQVVCPVEKKGAATTADMEAAAQLAADAELAEKLQKEEYASAEGRRANRTRSSNRTQQQQQRQSDGQSWYDWLTGASAPAAAPATRSSSSRATASSAAPSGSRGLVTAQTGEEGRSYGGGGGARIAEPKSMFSCVADSMGTAVSQMYTLSADEEGNVHGVDSQGLLAMPDVSRQREH